MKLHKSTKPGTCDICRKEYAAGFTLLLSDDNKLMGCRNCTALPIVAKIARLSTRELRWETHTKEKKFKCEACGNWNEPGTRKALQRIEGQQWQVCVACEKCPDLTEVDRAAIAAGITDADRKKLSDKEAAERGRHLTDEEAKDPKALRTRQGNWPRAWDALQHERDAVLVPLAEKRHISLERLKSAFEVLAIETPAIAGCTEMSLMRAFKTCLELGVYPGKGPLALAYLIPRADELTVQSGYKLYADLVLTLPGVSGLVTGVAWKCEQVLGNLAAPYHAILRAAREAARQQRPFNPDAIAEAARVVRGRGQKVLDQARALPQPTGLGAARELANRQALIAGLEIDLVTGGMEWFEWEWFRWHAPSDLVVIDFPPPGIWSRPRFDNQRGVLPDAAWARVTRRGASAVAEVVDWETVLVIAQKGGNAKANKDGGLDGSVWGDNQSCTWMWAKTALVQASTHGRLPLRAADPERMALLEHLDLAEPDSVDNAPMRAYTTLAEGATDRAAQFRAQAQAERAASQSQAPQIEEMPPEDYFEPEEERELVETRHEPSPEPAAQAAPAPRATRQRAAPQPAQADQAHAEPQAAGQGQELPLQKLTRYRTTLGEDIFASACRDLNLDVYAMLASYSAADVGRLIKSLAAEVHPDSQ